MKKETKQISTNTSSGAEKVENIEKEIKKKTSNGKSAVTMRTKTEKSAKGDAALGDSNKQHKENVNAKEQNALSTNGKAEAESAAAKARVEKALKRKEEKEKRKAERQEKARQKKQLRERRRADKKAKIEKRKQEKQAVIAKRAAAKKALAEKRAAEKKARGEARRHKKHTAKKSRQNTRREKRRENRQNQGYGGWIAAVVALGVTTLALATTSTVGMIENKKASDTMLSSYRGTMYEMTGILENVEKDLDRVRVSDSAAQQSRILTELLVQARLAESDIEKLPIAAESNRNITAFINRAGDFCEMILSKLRHGEPLTEKDRAILDDLYKTNHTLKAEVAKCLENMSDEDFMQYIKNGKGVFADNLQEMEKMTLDENMLTFKKQPPMDGMKQEKGGCQDKKCRLEAVKAEELCMQYFQGYDIAEYKCVGETLMRNYAAYNVQGYDSKGNLLFAEIDQMSGKLVRFDYYEECAGDTFDMKNAERIAEEFLETLGYDDMEVVRCRQNGTTVDFTFVYEDDDVVFYPDEVRVKVCRTRGVVSGMDASKYLQNHRGRDEINAKISLAEAYEKVYKELSVEASRLVVIQTMRGEKTAYEMLCSYQEDKYLIYLDATTGEELSIVNINTIQ